MKHLYRKEAGLDPSFTLSLVRKWGPSTRNIIRSMQCVINDDVDPIEVEVQGAVESTCASPSTIFDNSGGKSMPRNKISSVVFLRRPLSHSSNLTDCESFIPTLHLINLFEKRRRKMANKESLELFCALSSQGPLPVGPMKH
jgi:hypothetical protein